MKIYTIPINIDFKANSIEDAYKQLHELLKNHNELWQSGYSWFDKSNHDVIDEAKVNQIKEEFVGLTEVEQ